jgi:hypothetical protein
MCRFAGPPAIGRGSLGVAPVGFVGFDAVAGEQFAGVEVDDGDGGVVGDGEDAFAGVGRAGAEVVHAPGASEAHLAEGVKDVVAQSVVAGLSVAGRGGLGEGGVGGGRGAPGEFAVWAVVVVEVAECVELALQFGQGGCWWLGGEPAFEGLVEALDFSLGLRVAGVAVLLCDAEVGE